MRDGRAGPGARGAPGEGPAVLVEPVGASRLRVSISVGGVGPFGRWAGEVAASRSSAPGVATAIRLHLAGETSEGDLVAAITSRVEPDDACRLLAATRRMARVAGVG